MDAETFGPLPLPLDVSHLSEDGPRRPRTRGECIDGPRPCPWASCRHHLALDVTYNNALKVQDRELEELPATCALDVADAAESGVDNYTIADLLGISRQGVDALLASGLRKLRQLEVIR